VLALLVLLLILAVFGGLGFAAHFLWFVLIAAVVIWVIAVFMGAFSGGRGRRA
jgi:energy-coupling factor transporter transmembrane protein EcfT